jgi:imidazole glycerol-phosphate synthase subunit HisF
MFFNANPLLFERARELRNNLTPSEQIFWLRLKEHFPSYKFRRQHPISIYIADFYCHRLKLVIEIDGSIHHLPDVQINDVQRQRDLENLGLIVIRFTNDQIKNQIGEVIDQISSFIETLTADSEDMT